MADNDRTLASITEAMGFYTSLSLQTRGERLHMMNSINNSVPLLDKVGEELSIKDVVLQTVTVTNQQTGEMEGAVRTTLIDVDGNAYNATSKGIAQSLRQVFNIIGEPTTWGEPLKVVPREKKGANGFRFLTLDFVE